MRKSIEADSKADYYASRAKTVENNFAISSDDPQALTRLREKLELLQSLQDHMKKINAAHAKYIKNPNSLAQIEGLSDSDIKVITGFIPEYSWIKHPFAPYQLSNNSANMATVKKRIAKMESMERAQNKESKFGDITIIENADENRVQIFFPGKPADAIRGTLKSKGFRWSPRNGCWQAYYSNYAKWAAEEIVKGIAS
jgi:hypothetical protein